MCMHAPIGSAEITIISLQYFYCISVNKDRCLRRNIAVSTAYSAVRASLELIHRVGRHVDGRTENETTAAGRIWLPSGRPNHRCSASNHRYSARYVPMLPIKSFFLIIGQLVNCNNVGLFTGLRWSCSSLLGLVRLHDLQEKRITDRQTLAQKNSLYMRRHVYVKKELLQPKQIAWVCIVMVIVQQFSLMRVSGL